MSQDPHPSTTSGEEDETKNTHVDQEKHVSLRDVQDIVAWSGKLQALDQEPDQDVTLLFSCPLNVHHVQRFIAKGTLPSVSVLIDTHLLQVLSKLALRVSPAMASTHPWMIAGENLDIPRLTHILLMDVGGDLLWARCVQSQPSLGLWTQEQYKRVFAMSPIDQANKFGRRQSFESSHLHTVLAALDDEMWCHWMKSFGDVEAACEKWWIVVWLLQGKVQMNVELTDLFMDVCEGGCPESARILLTQNEIDRTVENNYCIQAAIAHGHIKTVKVLLSDNHVKSTTNIQNAINLASAAGHVDVVELLLEDERASSISDFDRAIFLAQRNGHQDIALLLLGLNPDSKAQQMCSLLSDMLIIDTKT